LQVSIICKQRSALLNAGLALGFKHLRFEGLIVGQDFQCLPSLAPRVENDGRAAYKQI